MELSFRCVNESVIPIMQEENALVTEYEKLLASAKIDWDGEILNLSLLGPYLKHKTRKSEDGHMKSRMHSSWVLRINWMSCTTSW